MAQHLRPPAAEPVREDRDFAHTGPGTLAGRYLREYWQPVFRSEDLASGAAVPLRVLGQDFTLYRGEDGIPAVIDFRCAHRGAQLSLGWVEDGCLRCFYHGWKYDRSGQCVEAPAESARFATKVQISSYPTQEALGLVFAYLGGGDPPPFPRYPGFDDFEGLVFSDGYVRRCNYFQSFENALDIVHTGFVHRGSHEYVGPELPELSVAESEAGITVVARRSDGATLINQIGMPNTQHMNFPAPPEIGWMGVMFWWVPIDDEYHTLFSVYRVPVTGDVAREFIERRAAVRSGRDLPHGVLAEQVLTGDLQMADIDLSRTDHIRLQDDLAQIGQGRIADRTRERLGRSDVGVILLRRLWTRELRALATGNSLAHWVAPTRLPVKYYEVLDQHEFENLELTKAR